MKTEYYTWDEAVEYSRYSANPVGRLVLMVCGYRDEQRALLSDKICTGLQLANFWQDCGARLRDSAPLHSRRVHGALRRRRGQIEGRVFTPEFGAMMRALVDRTRDMLREGAPLSAMVDDELRVTLDLFRKGGEAILDGIAAQNYDVLRGRPVVTRRKKLMLLLGALIGKLRTRRTAGVRSRVSEARTRAAPPARMHGPPRRTASAARSPAARRRTSTGPSAFCRATRATPCARSTPSCAAPTTSPTTNRSPSTPAAPR